MNPAAIFLEAIRFFKAAATQSRQPRIQRRVLPHVGKTASADAASVWQTDAFNRLHLVSSTDLSLDQATDITLLVGEGISGAAALSRQPVSVVNAQRLPFHDSRIDMRFGLQTYAMIQRQSFSKIISSASSIS